MRFNTFVIVLVAVVVLVWFMIITTTTKSEGYGQGATDLMMSKVILNPTLSDYFDKAEQRFYQRYGTFPPA